MELYLKVYGFTHTSNVDHVKVCKSQGNPHVPCRLDSCSLLIMVINSLAQNVICVYIYMYVCVCVCIYIYIYKT